MRTGKLAELAGVSVRTVRYYHQKGALPEPARQSNGYRDYTVDHLVALLRIRELTASGLSLEQAGAVVSETSSASAEDALDEVDRALEAQIAALTEQRRRLAQARTGRHVGLSSLAAALAVTPADIPSATLLAHAYGEGALTDRLIDALRTPEIRSALVSIQAQFDAVDAETSEEELHDLTQQMQSLIAALPESFPPLTEEQSRLILTLAERDLNQRQKELLRRQE